MGKDIMMLSVHSIHEAGQSVGMELSEKQCEQLVTFGRLLIQWNKVYNLTRLASEQDVLKLHILDSLAFVAAINGRHLPRVLDVGSGGGLPAIPLAVVRPETQVVMVDSVQKKTVFLQQVIMKTGLKNACVLHSRVEDLPNACFNAVTCRAFATLSKIVFLTRRFLVADGEWLLMKGKNPRDEIRDLEPDVLVKEDRKLVVPGTDLDRCLIVLGVN